MMMQKTLIHNDEAVAKVPKKMDANLPFLPGKNPFDIHVYFTQKEAMLAAALKARLLARFDFLKEGRWKDQAGRLSPHPLPMFELFGGEANNVAKVNEVIEWLDENRDGLSVLVHPNTKDGNLRDHSVHAVWLGPPVAVRLWVFRTQSFIKGVLVLASVSLVATKVMRLRAR